MKPRSPLTDEEKERGKTLYASGKSIYATARALGRSPHTLKKFLSRPETREQVAVQREELAVMFDAITHRTLSGVTDEDIHKSSLQQKMVSAGIAVDKAALLRNELPAAINVTLLLDVASMIREQRDQGDEEYARQCREQHALPPAPPK